MALTPIFAVSNTPEIFSDPVKNEVKLKQYNYIRRNPGKFFNVPKGKFSNTGKKPRKKLVIVVWIPGSYRKDPNSRHWPNITGIRKA